CVLIGACLMHAIKLVSLFFFFFSSRRRHTRSKRDWSSDVCSSDLVPDCSLREEQRAKTADVARWHRTVHPWLAPRSFRRHSRHRSEERRVGKECRSRREPYQEKKKRAKRRDHTRRE